MKRQIQYGCYFNLMPYSEFTLLCMITTAEKDQFVVFWTFKLCLSFYQEQR